MKFSIPKAAAAVALFVPLLAAASLSIAITEVSPTGSSASYGADWFEITNTGTSALNITGWRMDDNSNSFASSVALRGPTTLAIGQSIVYIEGGATSTGDAALNANFKSAWFGTAATPVIFANYGGSGVGLNAAGDAVNIFDTYGTLWARVDFGVSTLGTSFDNKAGLNNVVLTQKSVVGVNGGFTSATGNEIGSPGTIVTVVPEPETYALMLAGVAVVGVAARRRKNAA